MPRALIVEVRMMDGELTDREFERQLERADPAIIGARKPVDHGQV
jgi:hypothetical protein